MRCLMGYLGAAMAILMTVFASANTVMAEDELYLCGIVKDVDSKSGIVTIDVKSNGCYGIRKFRISYPINIASFSVDEEKCFFIDSNICEAKKTYSIIKD